MKNLRDAIANLQNRRDAAKAEGGFSFIELVIVVAVIGILTAIAIPAYGGIQATARTNAVKASAQQAYSAAIADFAQGGNLASATEAAESVESSDISIAVRGAGENDFGVTATWDGRTDVNPAHRGSTPTP